MKIFLIILLLSASMLSGFAQRASIIQGQIIGLKGSTVYLYSTNLLGGAAQLVDSVRLAGEYFSFRRPVREPTGYCLSIDETFGQFYFIWDKDLFVSLNSEDLNQSIVEDSPLNTQLKSFSDTVEIVYNRRFTEIRQAIHQAKQDGEAAKTQKLYQAYFELARQLNEATVTFIQRHKDSWVSLFALLAYHRDLGRRQTLSLMSIMHQSLQKNQLFAQLKANVSDANYPIIP